MKRMSWLWYGIQFVIVCGMCLSAVADEDKAIVSRSYPVGDLVIPITTADLSVTTANETVPVTPKPQFEPLVGYLKRFTGVENWVDGKGEIEEVSATLSLTVRQTSAVHERIVEELRRLRREQDLQTTQALTVVTGPRKEIAQLANAFPGELGRSEEKELQQKVLKSLTLKTVQAPKITTFNRQVGTLKFDAHVLLTQATISVDRRSVQLKISLAPQDRLTDLVATCQTLTIHDGRAVAVRFGASRPPMVIPPADDDSEYLVIVQPRIIVMEDEEQPLARVAKAAPEAARKQFEALKAQYVAASAASREARRKAKSDEEREIAYKQELDRNDYVRQFLQIAEAHPDDAMGIEALIWVASEDVFWEGGETALKILAEKYAGTPQVAEYASQNRCGGPVVPYEQLLRAAYRHTHKREVQAKIGLTLGIYLKMLKENHDQSLMLLACGQRGFQDRDNLNRWTEIGVDKLTAEAEQIFKSLILQYGDVKLDDGVPTSVVEVATKELYELRNLQIGCPAPDFETDDVHENPVKLSALRGKIVILDFGSHSGCGICSGIYPDLVNLMERFKDQPVELIGINQGDSPESLCELIASKKVTWRLIDDGDAWNGPISSKWAIDSMPTFYVIDHKGIIRGKGYFGLFEAMPTLIEKLLAERKAE